MDGVKAYSVALGVGEYYGLFACMVAGRSWSSITKGIDKSERTKAEVRNILFHMHLFIADELLTRLTICLLVILSSILGQRNKRQCCSIYQRNRRRIGIC